MNNRFKSFLDGRRTRIDGLLNEHLALISLGSPKLLTKAVRYVLLSGGKRLRPLLVYAVGNAYGAKLRSLDSPASAIEMIHAFSLVHDDLPAMDDDDLRRGKPTCHVAFDEATAILVGDSLAIGAFHLISKMKGISSKNKLLMIQVLAEAAGPNGMIGGQQIDLETTGKKPNKKCLEKMYRLKTGAMIGAAIMFGAIASGVKNKKELQLLERFGTSMGVAFQIMDDILDIEGDANRIGKNVGADKRQHKITYPSLVGIKKAKARVQDLRRQAEDILKQLKIKDSMLGELTRYIFERNF